MEEQRPLEEYLQAIRQFTNTDEQDLQTLRHGMGMVAIEVVDETYMVANKDDFRRLYTQLFEGRHYKGIGEEIPYQLWDLMLQDLPMTEDKFFRDLDKAHDEFLTKFEAWGSYVGYDTPYRKNVRLEMKDELEQFKARYHEDPSKPAETAYKLSQDLASIIGVVISKQFPDLKTFVDQAVNHLIETCGPQFMKSSIWEYTDVESNGKKERYYIYRPHFALSDF